MMSIFNNNYLFSHAYSLIKKMKEKGLVFPGSVVSKKDCEEILGVKYAKDDWSYIGQYLSLKIELESAGFFVTQRGLEAPSFRLLSTEEMAEHAMRRLVKTLATNYKTALVMSSHANVGSLNDRDRKVFDSIRTKAGQAALSQQKIILSETFFETEDDEESDD